MDVMELLVVGMVLTILVTLTLATVSYGAFKVRQRRAPDAHASEAQPLFFERVRFGGEPSAPRG